MDEIKVEWDPHKAEINLTKHGVSFDEAVTVFADEYAIMFDDPDHSEYEERTLILGFSSYARMLIVCHCVRGEGDIIRIISARKATKTERKKYAEYNGR